MSKSFWSQTKKLISRNMYGRRSVDLAYLFVKKSTNWTPTISISTITKCNPYENVIRLGSKRDFRHFRNVFRIFKWDFWIPGQKMALE